MNVRKQKNLLIYCDFFFFILSLFLMCLDVKRHPWGFCAMAFNFLFDNWDSKHIIIGLFEANYTRGVVMHVKLKTSLWQIFHFVKYIVVHVQNKGFNLHTCAMTLNLIVSCDGFNLVNTFHGYYFKHCTLKGF
jgi:hypothetical protein